MIATLYLGLLPNRVCSNASISRELIRQGQVARRSRWDGRRLIKFRSLKFGEKNPKTTIDKALGACIMVKLNAVFL